MQPSSQDACQLLFSTIIHVRYQQSASKDSPARPAHTLSRKGLSVVLDLDRLTDADKQSSLFSINKFNLLSFNERDYGPNHSSQKRQKLSQKIPLADYVRDVASSYMDSRIIHQIQLITFPRILGLSFNPISVYRCLTNRGEDCFIMYEVHNTFGDAHSYIAVGAGTGARQLHLSDKSLHVSPFFTVKGQYQLLLRQSGEQISLIVRYLDDKVPLLCATMRGHLMPLTTSSVLRSLLRGGHFPLRPLLSIHIEALKLWGKRFPFFGRPQPPETAFTTAAPLSAKKQSFNSKS
ncbi:DUF1365 domain-containing protein [Alphaproteobacteria bacterium]|jgi:DUF1365 family protein|nr:DUF1365 domain-containing protein [Alphaproteobacteria bacterium]MDA8881305.1 DUF1365 domain-containing protein [Alphaproteobacteria bacterium]MDA8915434.1 DUF1365 domain-containing protein [Alphaproteobacteria bacterium]